MTGRPTVAATDNDWRRVADRDPGPSPSLTVVVPVHERVALLDRTLAGLAAQTHDGFDVVVVDDGSTEDVAAVCARWEGRLRLRRDRRERSGFGAGAARDRGVELAEGEVVLFLDADCIPVPRLVARHLWWHARAENVAVVGSRRSVDSDPLAPEAIASGEVDLFAAVDVDPDDRLAPPDDWRALFARRTRRGLLGDATYRTMTTANLSVATDRVRRAGGFDPAFRLWGGEDTELAWRLWNDGVVVVPEDGALALHQVQLDGDTDRAAARRSTLPLVADRVPHEFYRRQPTPLALVPTVSWLVTVRSPDQLERAQRLVATVSPADAELVLVGPDEVVGHLVAAAGSNPRRHVEVVADEAVTGDWSAAAAAAVAATRGELVACVGAGVRVPTALVDRAVQRLHDQPGVDAFRASYTVDGDRWLRLDDLADVDAGLSGTGLPMFAVVRRRALRMRLDAAQGPAAQGPAAEGDAADGPAVAWQAIAADHDRLDLTIRDAVTLAGPPPTRPGTPGLAEARAVDAREVARVAVRRARALRDRARGSDGPRGDAAGDGSSAADADAEAVAADRRGSAGHGGEAPVQVEYVGLTGKDNLGDDAVRLAIERLLPWARVGVGLDDPRLLVVGGGTLLNGRGYYLTRMLRADAPVLDRALFGTGVRSPEFWGVTERMEDWFSFLDSTVHASVRGPDSVRNLVELGYDQQLEVIGDPALSLRPPVDVERVDGRVVVSPVWTDGSCHGGDDHAVFAALANTIARLRAEGREVVLLSCFPADDRWLIRLMRDAGAPELPYVDGYADVDDAVALLATADLVVGERLHAAILAASAGRPFVALEYRPKVRDFARSVDQEDAVVRTDEVDRLDAVVDTVLAELPERTAALAAHVDRYRRLQQAAAEQLHTHVRDSSA